MGKLTLIGSKKSSLRSALSDFEGVSPEKFHDFARLHNVPNGFLFVVGIMKYKQGKTFFRCGKDNLFMQNFFPYQQSGVFQTRDYGQIFSLYEPADKQPDDIVLSESAVYHRIGDNIKLILANGECRSRECVAEMFDYIIQEKQLLDFAPKDVLPRIYQVTFTKKSCGYFLKDRQYYVFATPVGIPDTQSGEVIKSWLFCDINCGAPAIIPIERETFKELSCNDGDKISIFTVRGNELVFEG